jgi:UDP-N-acetylmuramate--alanine ligase
MNESRIDRSEPTQISLRSNSSRNVSIEALKSARLHFMGIGGQGISAVAQMALQEGARISGCDQSASATTSMLIQKGVAVEIGHSPEHLANADALIYVPAVVAFNPDNPELAAAQARGMPVMTWQEMLGIWMQGKCVLSVSGVHGKGTTTAMLALMLVNAGLDPTCEIGAIIPSFGVNYRLGKSLYVVNEADEFNNNFWHYHPRLAVVTSIEFEHPEFFADYTAFLEAFEHFIRGMDMHGNWSFPPTLILNADSPGCQELRERLDNWSGHILTYAVEGLSQAKVVKTRSDYIAYDVQLEGETSFRIRSQVHRGKAFPTDRVIHLQLPGLHNIQNALGALTAAHVVGITDEVIISTLENFGGIVRRFEIRHQGMLKIDGEMEDVIVIDDYAHHPTAISATLEAARKLYPGRRLIAVYQPHMYSRTMTFFEQFITAFDYANVVIIADIFPGREHDTGTVHARTLVDAMVGRGHDTSGHAIPQVMYGGNLQNTAKLLRDTLHSGDIAIIMGAGDIYIVTEKLLHET